MKKDIKLISFDIDGTLINSKGELLAETKKLIEDLKKADYRMAFCTGRPFNAYWWIREELDLMGDDDLSINSTGAHIRKNSTGKALVNKVLAKADYEYLKSILDDDRVQIYVQTRDIMYTNYDKPNKAFLFDQKLVRMPRLKFDDFDQIDHMISKICFAGEPSVLDEFDQRHKSTLEEKYKYMRNATNVIEILKKGAGKSEGMKDLVDILGISLDNVMYFGDGNNDVNTIKSVGVGVAMGNAREACKDVADFVIGNNNEPSIANFVRKYLNLDE